MAFLANVSDTEWGNASSSISSLGRQSSAIVATAPRREPNAATSLRSASAGLRSHRLDATEAFPAFGAGVIVISICDGTDVSVSAAGAPVA